MYLKIKDKEYFKLLDENNNLILQLSISDFNSKKRLEELDKTKTYNIEIKEVKSKRSLEANRLLWKIIGDLSREMQDDEMNIYTLLLEETKAKFVWIKGLKETKDDLLRAYRIVKITRYDENGLAVFKCFEGSSKFNVSEMRELTEVDKNWASEFGLNYDKEPKYE